MRHGHVDYFAVKSTQFREISLSPDGVEQAEAAALALKHIAFDIAVYSGLQRTRETAERVLAAQENPPKLIAEEGLEELKNGVVTASSRKELAAWLAYSFDSADEDGATFLPEGERFDSAENRIVAAFTEMVTNGDWKSALVVAHEGVNRILLGWACGGGLATISAFDQDLAGVNVIDVDITPNAAGDGLQVERAIIKALNVTPYDYTKSGLPRTSLEHLFDIDWNGPRPKRPKM
ncbi:MAG: histidine phosphatase family protein [Marinicaulis sp.]|nr:histidine phosphatase family protein [Marinicaulis sp.]NNL88203.1 histidine phosphatase family protein [Marinicaulis sp.]